MKEKLQGTVYWTRYCVARSLHFESVSLEGGAFGRFNFVEGLQFPLYLGVVIPPSSVLSRCSSLVIETFCCGAILPRMIYM